MGIVIIETEGRLLPDDSCVTDRIVRVNNEPIDVLHVCKRITVIHDTQAMHEMFKISADMYDMPLLSQRLDKSAIPLLRFQNKSQTLKLIDEISDFHKAFSVQNDYEEYQYFITHDMELAQQVAKIIAKPQIQNYIEQQQKTASSPQSIKENIQRESMRLVLEYLDLQHRYLFCRPLFRTKQNSLPKLPRCCVTQTSHLLDDSKEKASHSTYKANMPILITYLLGSSQAIESLRYLTYDEHRDCLHMLNVPDYSIDNTYNIFHLCQRVVNINFLPNAPYGPVSIGYASLNLVSDAVTNTLYLKHAKQFDTFLTYISPEAHLSVEQAEHSLVAIVSVAKLHSISALRVGRFYNYAIYFPEDIYAAIALRFGESQIVDMLLHRVSLLERKKIYIPDRSDVARCAEAAPCRDARQARETHALVKFDTLKIYVFYDQGIFNARFASTQIEGSREAREALQELVDIYRNMHYLGVNTYHCDVSALFPRVTLYFSSNAEYRDFHSGEAIMINSVLTHICLMAKNVQQFCSMQPINVKKLHKLYTLNALHSQFCMARENLRLALSMTHSSVHEYIKFIEHKSTTGHIDENINRYIQIIILHAGYYSCWTCQLAYSRAKERLKTHDVDSDRVDSIHNENTVNALCEQLHTLWKPLVVVNAQLSQDATKILQCLSSLSDKVYEVDINQFKTIATLLPKLENCKSISDHILKEICSNNIIRRCADMSTSQQKKAQRLAPSTILEEHMYRYPDDTRAMHLNAVDIQLARIRPSLASSYVTVASNLCTYSTF